MTTDFDGIDFCDPWVLSTSAFYEFGRALKQTDKSLWTKPTEDQITYMDNIVFAFEQLIKVHKQYKLTKENAQYFKPFSSIIINECKLLGLVCERAKTPDDSYLIIYTKPGIKNYFGPFLMLREINASKLIIVSPHDGTDNTSIDTKLAFKNTRALALISNGCPHFSRESDFVHSENTLGYNVMKRLMKVTDKIIVLHIHGMSENNKILRRGRPDILVEKFDKVALKYVSEVDPLNASFVIDSLCDQMIKTEIPVRIHKNRPEIIEDIVNAVSQSSPGSEVSSISQTESSKSSDSSVVISNETNPPDSETTFNEIPDSLLE
jgi:hypothetical protein